MARVWPVCGSCGGLVPGKRAPRGVAACHECGAELAQRASLESLMSFAHEPRDVLIANREPSPPWELTAHDRRLLRRMAIATD